MKLACTLCGLLIAVVLVNANPIVKREAEDLSPLNEVYVSQADEDSLADGERGDRDKRKIGIVKLGVTNGIINFVFGKLDSFLDAKTRALAALDEGNKAKNVAFGIDNRASATGSFISNLISQKIQAGTASIGPLINGATTFISTASSGLSNAFASKVAPFTNILGGASAGGDGSSGGGLGGGLGGILSSGIELISGLSGGSNLSGGNGDSGSSSAGAGFNFGGSTGGSAGAGASASVNFGGSTISTTTEDIPEFDRVHVSLDVPPPVFGSGFTVVTDISKILSGVITNSARRTESVLELFKPVFRGAFAIKGLPSDRPK